MASRSHRPIGRKYIDILRALYHLDSEQRKVILRRADPQLVRHICECALNVLNGNVTLTKNHKSRLRKHAPVLRKLASPHDNLGNKKRIVAQHGGGFLPALLAPLIGTILSDLLTK